MKAPEPVDPRTAPIVALRGLLRLPDRPDQEARAEAKLLRKLEPSK